jgi:hypothetical protein
VLLLVRECMSWYETQNEGIYNKKFDYSNVSKLSIGREK